MELPVKINLGKGIGCILKYDQWNWLYQYPNITFIILPRFDIYIQIKCNSASDASVGANDVSSYRLYQSTNHHGNMYDKDNDDSQSYEIPRKNNFRSSSSGDTVTTTTTPKSPTLPSPVKYHLCFKIEGEVPMDNNVIN